MHAAGGSFPTSDQAEIAVPFQVDIANPDGFVDQPGPMVIDEFHEHPTCC
jgi:hypothetical protein